MSVKITANLKTVKFNFDEETDYSGESYSAPAEAIGLKFKITDPTGTVIYNNTSTTAYDTYPLDDTEFNTVGLPIDANSQPLQGDYEIVITRDYVDGDGEYVSGRDVLTCTFELDFETPTAEITPTIDYVAPLIKGKDTTNYLVNGVLPTHDRDNRIIHSNMIDPQPSDVVSTSSIVSTSTFYSSSGGLEYVFKLENDPTYEFASAVTVSTLLDGETEATTSTQSLFVLTTLSDIEQVELSAPEDICAVFCVLKKLIERYQVEKSCENFGELGRISRVIATVSLYSQLIKDAYYCGKQNLIPGFKQAILDEVKGTVDCDCCSGSDAPALVQGLGGSGSNISIVNTDNYLDITLEGDQYTINLSDTLLTILNSVSYNVTSVSGAITVSSSVVNGVTTFDLDIADGYMSNRLDVEVSFLFDGLALQTPIILNQTLTGESFKEVSQGGSPLFVTNDSTYVTDLASFLTNIARYKISDFYDGAAFDYFISTEIVRHGGNDPFATFPIEAIIDHHDDANAYLMFRHADGSLVTGQWLVDNVPDRIFVKLTFTA